jgi:hypothetical protein
MVSTREVVTMDLLTRTWTVPVPVSAISDRLTSALVCAPGLQSDAEKCQGRQAGSSGDALWSGAARGQRERKGGRFARVSGVKGMQATSFMELTTI